MLSSFDDFPNHQTSHAVAKTASSDINHFDRYFFNGYTPDTRLYFAAALGLYPNRHVADAHFSVLLDGGTIDARQVNVHASRRAPLDRSDANNVGPIDVEVIIPLPQLRLTVDAAEHGIRADLTFTRRTAPIQEPHFDLQVGHRVVMDSTRMTQFGTWTGWIEVDGALTELADDVHGSRDRSWGVRPVGEPARTGAPVADPQYFWLWAPINFELFATHFDVNEHFDGRRWHETGFVVQIDGTGSAAHAEAMRAVDYRIEWKPGTRSAKSFEIDLVPWEGEPTSVRLEPLFDFQMTGVGYGHPDWRHGAWKGEYVVDGDRWQLPVDDPTTIENLHIQTVARATTSGGLGEHVGLGILEQLAIGRHDPTGLSGLSAGFA